MAGREAGRDEGREEGRDEARRGEAEGLREDVEEKVEDEENPLEEALLGDMVLKGFSGLLWPGTTCGVGVSRGGALWDARRAWRRCVGRASGAWRGRASWRSVSQDFPTKVASAWLSVTCSSNTLGKGRWWG